MSLFASLDLGSNTFRLLIASITGGSFIEPVVIKRSITRLGEGFHPSSIIQPDAIERSIDVLESFSRTIRLYQVAKVCAVTTSVVREAKNGREFLSLVFERTGIEVKEIAGEEEAQLMLKGVWSVTHSPLKHTLVIDIGGGSTELILTDNTHPLSSESIPLGALHLSEQFITTDPPTAKELLNLRNYINNILHHTAVNNTIFSRVLFSKSSTDCALIGTAGTITTLAAIDQQMEHYDPQRINNHTLPFNAVNELFDRLCVLTVDGRSALPGLEKGRETVIVPGTAVLLEIMQLFNFSQITVSDSGLLEGVMLNAVSSR